MLVEISSGVQAHRAVANSFPHSLAKQRLDRSSPMVVFPLEFPCYPCFNACIPLQSNGLIGLLFSFVSLS